MCALESPVAHAGVEAGVANAIRAAGEKHLNVVQLGATCALQNDIELVGRSGGRMNVIGESATVDQCPGGFRLFQTALPIGGQMIIAVRIDQFQTAAGAISKFAPTSAIAIRDVVHEHKVGFGDDCEIRIGFDDDLGPRQCDSFAAVGKISGEVAEDDRAAQDGIIR